MKIVWSEDAKARVRECVDYLVDEINAAFAEDWLNGLGERVSVLANRPLIGREVPEIRPGCRRRGGYRLGGGGRVRPCVRMARGARDGILPSDVPESSGGYWKG